MPFLTSAQAALKQFKHLVFAAGAVILWGLCAALPVSIASRVGSNLLKTIGPRTRKHKHIIKNLRQPDPEEIPVTLLLGLHSMIMDTD